MDFLTPTDMPVPILKKLITEYSAEASLANYAKKRPLAASLIYNENILEIEFLDLLRKLDAEGAEIRKAKEGLSVQQFWKHVCSVTDMGIDLLSFLNHVFTLPVGSADAERGFSLFLLEQNVEVV